MRLLAGLAVLLVAVPAVAALDTLQITFPLGFDRMHAQVDAQLGGEQSEGIRQAADASFGDGDGHATQAEVDLLAAAAKDEISDRLASEFTGGNMTLDGNGPTLVKVADLRFSDAEGDVTSQRAMTAHVSMDVSFAPGPGSEHALHMRDDQRTADTAQPAQMTLQAPTGFVVSSVAGIPDYTLNPDRSTLTVTDTEANRADHEGATILFAPPAARSGASAATLGIALLAGAALLRRRA
jgi:hypothetical protein